MNIFRAEHPEFPLSVGVTEGRSTVEGLCLICMRAVGGSIFWEYKGLALAGASHMNQEKRVCMCVCMYMSVHVCVTYCRLSQILGSYDNV